MEHDVRLDQHHGHPLAVVRRRANSQELSRVVPEACGTVWNVVRAQKVTGAGRHVAVYWDSQINLEVGVEVGAPFAGHGEVVGSATPAGRVATTTHYGPYNKLHEAHEAICRWCRNNGYALAGPNWEIYGHWRDEWNSDPTRICTDVFYLLALDGSSTANPDPAPDHVEISVFWIERLSGHRGRPVGQGVTRMELFGWLWSHRRTPQPPALPVRYGLGPPPEKPSNPDELWSLCGGEVAEVRWVIHWSQYNGLRGTVWQGRCSVCDTVLGRRFAENDSSAWRASVPPPEKLLAVVPDDELKVLTTRFGRLTLTDRMWAEFLATRRTGDEVRRFVGEGELEGFAVVRSGRPLAEFLAPAPDFERALHEHAPRQTSPGADVI